MNKNYCNIFISTLFLAIFLIYAPNAFAQSYGLKFQGQDVTLDKRTELDLTPNEFLEFQDEFEISFDYKIDLIKPNSIFGYVFRIINRENYNVDLLSTPSPDIKLNLVVGKRNSIIPVNYPVNAINNWINLRIKFILSEERMILYTPDTFYVQDRIGFKKQDAFKIIFGANDYYQFKTTDVPSINIRNIKLLEKGSLKYHWYLDEIEGAIATDKIKKQKATIKNPIWLKLRHQCWQADFSTDVAGPLMVAFDEENEKVFMVGSDELLIYSAENNNTQQVKYQNKPLFINTSYKAIYNNREKRIYCYLVDDKPYYSLDIETGEWNQTGATSDYLTKYDNHNRFYNARDNSIYLFGGYGFHQYNNEIRKIDLTNNTFQDMPTNDTVFHPRYLSGLGALHDTVYILGGYGSASGNQLINPQSYYDLIGYSIKNGSLFKKFEIPKIIDDMTFANSMWIDEHTRNYYAFVFEKSKFDGFLQLIKGSLDSPEIEMVGDRIPFQFLDVRSFASLFYMPKQRKLYAYTSYLSESNNSQAAIYSINFPPDKFEEGTVVVQKSKTFPYLFLILAILILAGFVVWYFRKRSNQITVKQLPEKEDSSREEPVIHSMEHRIEESAYQLIFFGGFQVFNKDHVDITNKFSPLLKELFLLIMLYSSKNNKGISSEAITEILWFDKSDKSARNNKAVNIAKVRSILCEIGNCELTKKTGYWKIIPDGQMINCDYVDFLDITSSKTNLTKQKINRLIKITQKGAFLTGANYEWLDEFKSSVSDIIIDTLVQFSLSCDIKKEAEFIIHLADSIFNFDIVNEDAMVLKCKAEYYMGKHSLAKSTYERFIKDYITMYNQQYEHSFLKILEI